MERTFPWWPDVYHCMGRWPRKSGCGLGYFFLMQMQLLFFWVGSVGTKTFQWVHDIQQREGNHSVGLQGQPPSLQSRLPAAADWSKSPILGHMLSMGYSRPSWTLPSQGGLRMTSGHGKRISSHLGSSCLNHWGCFLVLLRLEFALIKEINEIQHTLLTPHMFWGAPGKPQCC